MTSRCLLIAFLTSACTDSTPPPDPSPPDAPPRLVESPSLDRAPDLRFQWVGSFPKYVQGLTTNVIADGGSGITETYTGPVAWSPLQVAGGDSWEITIFSPEIPIQDLVTVATAGGIADVEADTTALLAQGGVVTSLDFSSDSYAMIVTSVADGQTGYDSLRFTSDRAGLAAQLVPGFVLTAITGDGTTLHAMAFRPWGDQTTFETSIVDATTATLTDQATMLAADGYIVTAFGRNGDGLILVGTRPTGTTTPHTIVASHDLDPAIPEGYAIVGWAFDVASFTSTVIFER